MAIAVPFQRRPVCLSVLTGKAGIKAIDWGKESNMRNPPLLPIRVRKFIGMLLIVALVFFYAIVVAALGASTRCRPTNSLNLCFISSPAWDGPSPLQSSSGGCSALTGKTSLKTSIETAKLNNVQNGENNNEDDNRQNGRHRFSSSQLALAGCKWSGAAGFEPTTPCPPDKCATGCATLRLVPI